MKTRLLHTRANVRDLQRAIDWYKNVLGFEVEAMWPSDEPHYAHFVSEEGATFSVATIGSAPSAARFNFSVADVDGLWQELQGQVEVVEPLFDTPYGTRKFTILDPDGNELGFVNG